MTRVEQLMEHSEKCARELADALRVHADESTLQTFQKRLSDAQRSWKEETLRVVRRRDLK